MSWLEKPVNLDRYRDDRAADRDEADRAADLSPNGASPVSSPPPAGEAPSLFTYRLTRTQVHLTAAAIHCAIGLMHEMQFSTTELEELRSQFLGGVQ